MWVKLWVPTALEIIVRADEVVFLNELPDFLADILGQAHLGVHFQLEGFPKPLPLIQVATVDQVIAVAGPTRRTACSTAFATESPSRRNPTQEK